MNRCKIDDNSLKENDMACILLHNSKASYISLSLFIYFSIYYKSKSKKPYNNVPCLTLKCHCLLSQINAPSIEYQL